MNKNTIRIFSASLALLISIGSMSMISSAEYTYGPATNEDVQIAVALREKDSVSDTVYVDSAELEKGDYTFKASVCLETDDSLLDMWHFHAYWDAVTENEVETPYIVTENMITYTQKWNDDRVNKILEEVNAEGYTYIPGNYQVGTPYSAGPGKIYIEDKYTGEPIFYDLAIDEETGVATTEVYKLGYEGNDNRMMTLTINHYNPEIPYGELIWKEQNKMSIHCLSGFSEAWTTEKVNGLNEMGYFDVVIDQDTPDGIYYLQLQDAYMHGNGLKAVTTNIDSQGCDPSYWLKIVVGDSAEAEPAAEAYDVNLDGQVSIDDAADVLRIYAETAAGINNDVQILQAGNVNADVDGDGSVTISDAVAVLTEYSRKGAGLE